jgi:hypothetical protein
VASHVHDMSRNSHADIFDHMVVHVVIRETAIAELAVRHLLVADANMLAVALPPPGVPGPLARSSEVHPYSPLSPVFSPVFVLCQVSLTLSLSAYGLGERFSFRVRFISLWLMRWLVLVNRKKWGQVQTLLLGLCLSCARLSMCSSTWHRHIV